MNPAEQLGLGATACCCQDSIVLHKEPSKKQEEKNKGSAQDLMWNESKESMKSDTEMAFSLPSFQHSQEIELKKVFFQSSKEAACEQAKVVAFA